MAGNVAAQLLFRTEEASTCRRPLKTRDRTWARLCAAWLAHRGASPNAISLCSSLFSAGAGLALISAPRLSSPACAAGLVAAAAFIQLRLACNLMDGMVAIEGGRKSMTGEVWNDLPDRVSDVFILAGAGYGLLFSWGPALGWLAAVLAVLTAYVRLLAGTVGATQRFLGPMAKQHRMALMTAASLLSCVETYLLPRGTVIASALFLIAIGSLLTVARRLRWIRRDLES